jgi:bifunctional DNA-binding transcriptional regulator/antitoxin component of YhaV-PrlF toxin-antitoxin module
MSNQYTVQVELDDNGEECLPFPEELVKELGWQVGDVICWRSEGDGWVLVKKDDNK